MTTKSDIIALIVVANASATKIEGYIPHGAGFTTDIETEVTTLKTAIAAIDTYVDTYL